MFNLSFILVLVIFVALLFEFTNGWNDAANAIATVVSTRVLSPMSAIMMAAFLNFAGALVSTKVAKMVGGGLVVADVITPNTILAALMAAAFWNGFMTVLGLPVSGSHALIGGLLGAALMAAGVAAVKIKGILIVLTALFISPFLGFLFGGALMVSLMWMFRKVAPSLINRRFGALQILSAGSMSFSHGTNDAQKVMGIITLALVSGGVQQTMEVPFWVILICALVMGLGTALGGWRVIKTVGHGLMKMQPVHGFAAETSAVAVLMSAAGLGIPVSTTHTITSSIIGVGAAKKFSAVKWGVGGKIVIAWVFTFPFTMGIAAAIAFLLK
ncbi:anion permease [bacterium F11]|nr:anion permease [bacterium F11]